MVTHASRIASFETGGDGVRAFGAGTAPCLAKSLVVFTLAI
jgi:hypothetical protein